MIENLISASAGKHLLRFTTARLPNRARAVLQSRGEPSVSAEPPIHFRDRPPGFGPHGQPGRERQTSLWPVANPPPAGQNNPHARPSPETLMGLLDKIRGEFIDI